MTEISEWLERKGLGEYTQVFTDARVDLDVLSELDADDLKDLGIPLGDRKRLLKAAKALEDQDMPSEPDPQHLARDPPGAAQAERRQLTVLFCDLVGSTQLSQRLDPEDLSDVNRAFHDVCTSVLTRYGGYIARYMGDGVLAYFGYPQAHEDDAERAVRSAMGLLAGTEELTLPAEAGVERLYARVGIATGLVVVGDLAHGAGAQERTVFGDTPNLAARLQSLAEPGQTLIGPRTRRLLGERFELRDLGPQTLKGFQSRVSVWALIGEGRAETRFEAVRGAELTPFVGREEEFQTLLARWRRSADEGAGQVVVLEGEAGIGKSRLLERIGARLSEEGSTRLWYQCSPFHVNSAFHPFITHMHRVCDLSNARGPDERLGALEAVVEAGGTGWKDRMPFIAALLSVDTCGRYPALELPPEQQRAQTVRVTIEQMAGLSVRKPVLVLFEDVHWIDPTSLDVLNRLIERVQQLRMLVIVTCRPQFVPSWTGQPHVSLIALKRMDRGHCRALIERVLGGRTLPGAVADLIVDRTDGIPLFVEELTKSVLESDLLALCGDRYELSGDLSTLPVPDTLQESLMARLDRRSEVKAVCQIGAAIGREFDYELLAAVSSLSESEIGSAIDRLVESGLIYRRGEEPFATYLFKHALVQDAAYESLLLSRRRKIHEEIACALAEQFAQRIVHQPEVLAHHYTAAGLTGPAIDHWALAAERAAGQGSHEEACSHLRRALELVADVAPEDERVGLTLDLQLALIESLRTVDRYGEALELLQEAENLAASACRHPELAQVHYQRGNIYFPQGNHDGCLEEHNQALQFARAAGSPQAEAQALGGIGDAHYLDGRMRSAFDNFERCVRLCRQHGLERIEAANLHMMGWSRYYGFEFEQALEDGRRTVDLAARTRHHRAQLLGLALTGCVNVLLGRVDAADEAIEAALGVARRIRSLAFEGRVLADRASALALRDERHRAVTAAHEAVDKLRAGGMRFFGPYALGVLARVTEDAGEREAALQEAETLLSKGCVAHNYYYFYRDAIETSLDASDWDRAERFANALTEYDRREPWEWSRYFAARGHAMAAWGRGEYVRNAANTVRDLQVEATNVGLARESASFQPTIGHRVSATRARAR